MRFEGFADKIDQLIHCIFDFEARKSWDQNIKDHFIANEAIINGNMIVVSEEVNEMVLGYDMRQCVKKRFFWRDSGAFFVY